MAERVNLTLLDGVRAVLFTETFDDFYCPYAMRYVAFNKRLLTHSKTELFPYV